jgi:hypothetical protein
MITEQEAREAAKIVLRGWDDYYRPKTQREVAEHKAATWITEELARREAERAERAKPIDAEWCLSANGEHRDVEWFRWRIGRHVIDWRFYHVYLDSCLSDAITTRGQLLDLLAALKGGA